MIPFRTIPVAFAAMAIALICTLVGSAGAHSDQANGADGIHGADDRRLLSEFTLEGVTDQEAMRGRLAATQGLSCGSASASLVYRPDVIIFSAHQVFGDDGKPSPDLARCVLTVTRKDGSQVRSETYPLRLETLDHGPQLPLDKVGDGWNRGNQNDWAIARLARPVVGIEPYRLPDEAGLLAPQSAVTTVSQVTSNWQGHTDPGDELAQACHVVAAEPRLATVFPGVVHLDCDVGAGASGGAILQDVASGAPRYVGTIIAYTGRSCPAAGIDNCFSIGRRLDADLIARIEGTTAIRLTPAEKALGAAQDQRLAAARDEAARRAVAAAVAPFPVRSDTEGGKAAELYARIAALIAAGHADQTDPLFLEIYRLLHDPNQNRPEWPPLLLENGESMLQQHRLGDAFECFHAAFATAPEALKPFLLVRMAQATLDPKQRRKALREAYLTGGDLLFLAAKAEAELAEVKAKDLETGEE